MVSRPVDLSVKRAEVAELADAHGSGPCTRKGVEVQVLSSAPISVLPVRGNLERQVQDQAAADGFDRVVVAEVAQTARPELYHAKV